MTTYEVKSGDSLSAIAGRAGVTLAQLEALNPELAREAANGKRGTHSFDTIFPGDQVRLPDAARPIGGDSGIPSCARKQLGMSAPVAPQTGSGGLAGMGLSAGALAQASRVPGAAQRFATPTLDSATEARIERAQYSETDKGLVQFMTRGKTFREASPADRGKILDTFDAAGPAGRFDVAILTGDRGNRPAAILDKDFKGGRLLDNLHQIATGPISDQFEKQGISRQKLLDDVAFDAANPQRMQQGGHGTCTVTSIAGELDKDHPGEYARLVAGLVSPSGQVTLANGDTMTRVADSIGDNGDKDRKTSERLMQAGLMNYGSKGGYSDAKDKTSGTVERSGVAGALADKVLGKKSYEIGGLGLEGEKRVLEGVFGRPFDVINGADKFDQLKARSGKDTFTALQWGTGTGSHAVTVETVKDGRVYFRNPQGNRKMNGTEIPESEHDPARRIEDFSRDLESMSEADFKKAMVWSLAGKGS